MPRNKLLLPFGGGVDRGTGSAVVDSDAMHDLRNVHLSRGRMEHRRGNPRRHLIDWGDDILGIFTARAEGVSAVVVFDATSRDVRLYFVDSEFNQSFLGTLWTLPEGAAPIVLAAEAYNTIVFAHDEEDFDLRQATKYVNVLTGAISTLTVDLDRDSDAETIKFRGVTRHLNYIVGWGYGTGADEDRPEVLRISLPGHPTVFVPETFFLVGMPGDPIVGAGSVNGVLEVTKGAKAYFLAGSSTLDFGMTKEVDEHFGQLRSRLAVTVGNERFRWTAEGPRISNGTPSKDAEFPLDLEAPAPDDAAPYPEFQYPDDANDGFAYFDPVKGEVIFCFGFWGYVLHIKDSARRWSYRTFDENVMCAGTVYTGGTARVDAGIGGLPAWVMHAGASGLSIAWSEPLHLWCAVGNAGIFTSPDGENWTLRVGASPFRKVCWGNDRFVVTGDATGPLFSLDGIVWTGATTVPAPGLEWGDVCYAAGAINLFVAIVNLGTTDWIATSPTGVTWTARVTPDTAPVAIAFSDELDIIVAVGGVAGATMTSIDAIAWAGHTAPDTDLYLDVTYVPAPVSLFVMCKDTGANRVATSGDGVTWEAQTTPDNAGYSTIASNRSHEGLPLIIALSGYGTAEAPGLRSITSRDGVEWVSRELPSEQVGNLLGLDYSEFLHQWVGISPNDPALNVMVGS